MSMRDVWGVLILAAGSVSFMVAASATRQEHVISRVHQIQQSLADIQRR